MTEPRSTADLAALERCGDHPRFGSSTRETLNLGCGTFLTGETDAKLAYRCAQCRTAFCETCIKQHFGWPEAGGGPMPHDLDKAIVALRAAARPADGEGLREKRDRLDAIYRASLNNGSAEADKIREAALLGIAIYAALAADNPST